ncbi:MAG: hypothetical protein ACHREM_15165 [Polyangiales bacterium]
MKITPWYLAALSPFAILGFSSAMVGQLALLVVVLAIFFGTLSLNRFTTASAASEQGGSGH